MRVVIDATTWTNPRGFGRYTRSLVGRLLEVDGSDEYVLLFDRRLPPDLRLPGRARAVAVPTSASLEAILATGGRRPLGDLWRMARATARHAPDVVFFPSVDSFFPVRPGVPVVVTIHDAIAEQQPELLALSASARRLRRLKVWMALRQATRVVLDAEYSRRDLCRHYGLPRSRTAVVVCGADDVFRPPADLSAARAAAARLGARLPYLLYVGDAARHKNVPALVAAFARLAAHDRQPPVSLVVAGPERGGGALRAAFTEAASLHGVADRVTCVGCPDDADLAVLYQAAEALVVASLKEGFGLPAIEAVACGTPAVVTRESPLPELLGEAAIAVDPHSVDDIARGLAWAVGDAGARARLRTGVQRLAGLFSWSRAAASLHATLAEVLRERGGAR